MSDLPICTIISKNYLSYARTLVSSYRRHNSEKTFVLLVDRIDGYFKPENEPFTLIPIEELAGEIPEIERFCFQYSITELNTAAKPYFLSYLFRKYDLKKVIYLDPDCWVVNQMDELSALLNTHAIVLTPHITEPIEDSFEPDEIQFLRVGAYNLGFIGLSRTPETLKFLEWWKKRLWNRCIVAPEHGLFVDQKWIDLAPGLFGKVHVLREPGYNIAYWNFHSRKLTTMDGQFQVNGEPVYFLHFSGFNPENMEMISRYQNRWSLSKLQPAENVFTEYRNELLKNGYLQTKTWPYAFGYFDNGKKIPDYARRIYLKLGVKAKRYGNPFHASQKNSFYHYLRWRLFFLERLLSWGMNHRFQLKKYPKIYKIAKTIYVALSRL